MSINQKRAFERPPGDLMLTMSVRVSADEKSKISRLAAANGVSISEYLRSLALQQSLRTRGKRLPSVEEKHLACMVGQLGNIGAQLRRIFPGGSCRDIQPLIDSLQHLVNTLIKVAL